MGLAPAGLPSRSRTRPWPPARKAAPHRLATPTTSARLSAPSLAPPPPRPDPGAADAGQPRALVAKFVAAGVLAEAMPYNENKAGEHGEAAREPQPGSSVEPVDPGVVGSTVSELNTSPKVGDGPPPPGVNATIGSLDRVRVDASGQPLTTNQGVRIADNQNSLKVGLRGPTLLGGLHPPREDHPLRPRAHSRSASSTPAARRRTATSSARADITDITKRGAVSPRPASGRRSSCASRPWPASAARPTPRATCAASPSSSTPTKATGTWSATTSRCSSSRTR